MSEELLINYTPMESRMAVLTDGVTSEILIERHQKLGLVGNIYLGTVARVLPGMQAAFVDIGQARTAFLHANDMQKPKRSSDSLDEHHQHRLHSFASHIKVTLLKMSVLSKMGIAQPSISKDLLYPKNLSHQTLN